MKAVFLERTHLTGEGNEERRRREEKRAYALQEVVLANAGEPADGNPHRLS